jgi:hypothetical protein
MLQRSSGGWQAACHLPCYKILFFFKMRQFLLRLKQNEQPPYHS